MRPTNGTAGTRSYERPGRAVRAGARRDIDPLLEDAEAFFLAAGADTPVRAIAHWAGVGIRTVDQRFPCRAELIEAMRRHADAHLAKRRRRVANASPAGAA